MAREIKVGDRVRTFDFEGRDLTGERACYAEGMVLGIGRFDFPDCDRYRVLVEKRVWAGAEDELTDLDRISDRIVYPPVNGTPVVGRMNSRVCDGVELITNGG